MDISKESRLRQNGTNARAQGQNIILKGTSAFWIIDRYLE